MEDPLVEEIRIALVMNGGVSLAVWMGGVTNEISRLVTQSHPVYRKLLELTKSTVKVDVISGTSAGGINGAALATSLLYGGQFDSLRQVWRETGALEDLLCSPFGKNPGSLFQGDGFFLPHIRSALAGLALQPTPINKPYTDSIDLQLTTTLLTGRRVRTIDSLGTQIGDVDYRAHFRFRYRQGPAAQYDYEHDYAFVNQAQTLDALSRAARSSASFPFAFEPSTIDAGAAARLFDALDNPLVMKRHVIDGGILDNKPIRGALRAIFNCPRERGVRRVLAYINPDPGNGPVPASMDQTPPLSRVLASSLLGIPQSQSIADQLQEIEAHNRAVGFRRDNVLNLVKAQTDHLALAHSLFKVYRRRRIINTCQLFVLDVLPTVTSAEPGAVMPSARDICGEPNGVNAGSAEDTSNMPIQRVPELEDALAVLGRQSRATIRLTFEKIEWDQWIPLEWPVLSDDKNQCGANWEWGLFPVEFSARVMLDCLRLTQRLADISNALGTLAKQQSSCRRESHVETESGTTRSRTPGTDSVAGKPIAPRRTQQAWAAELPFDWHDHDDRDATQFPERDDAPTSLAALWRRAYDVLGDIEKQRAGERTQWETNAIGFLCGIKAELETQGAQGAHGASGGMDAGVQFTYVAKPKVYRKMFAFLGKPSRRAACARMAYLIAGVVRATCEEATTIIVDIHREGFTPLGDRCALSGQDPGKHRKRDEMNRLMWDQLDDLKALKDFFEGKTRAPGRSAPVAQAASDTPLDRDRAVLYRLLQLEVIQYSFNDRDELTDDTAIELVQISGDSSSPFMTPGAFTSARDKLLGLQVAHFAAFYKQSWRMNDWTYGRLDGSERLVKLLLNPERLQLAFMDPDIATEAIQAIALGDLVPGPMKAYLNTLWTKRNYFSRLCAELSFLSNNRLPLPDMLPLCAEVITLRLHLGILRDELPHLVAAIEGDLGAGADDDGRSRRLLKLLGNAQAPIRFSPEEAAQACCEGLIAGERLSDEVGSDLFTRTVGHIVAATQRTLASESAKLGPIRALSASVRVPILGFYLTARALTHQSRTSAALNGALLVVGFVLVCLQFLWVSIVPVSPTVAVPPLAASGTTAVMPHTLATFGWVLFTYGVIVSLFRWRTRLTGVCVVVFCTALAIVTYRFYHAASFDAFVRNASFGLWIIAVGLAVLVVGGMWFAVLQTITGFAIVLVAGVAGTGKLECLGEQPLAWLLKKTMGCSLPSLFEPPVILSMVVVLALCLAIAQHTQLSQRKASSPTRRKF